MSSDQLPHAQVPMDLGNCSPGFNLSPNLRSKQPGSALLLPHTLDRDKQTKNLIQSTSKPDVEFVISPSQENVNVLCNPGFYDQVARPAFCDLTQGFSFTVNSLTLSCSEVTPHLDRTLVEERRLVKFYFLLGGVPGTVSIHFHHTTCNIQVQGARKMPDMSSAAVWFVKNALYERLTYMSKTKQYDIQAYHRALLRLSCKESSIDTQAETLSPTVHKCGHCSKVSIGRSEPVPCITCPATLHKTCVKPHTCPTSLKRAASDITAFEDSEEEEISSDYPRPSHPTQCQPNHILPSILSSISIGSTVAADPPHIDPPALYSLPSFSSIPSLTWNGMGPSTYVSIPASSVPSPTQTTTSVHTAQQVMLRVSAQHPLLLPFSHLSQETGQSSQLSVPRRHRYPQSLFRLSIYRRK